MPTLTLSSREFNQHASSAKKASNTSPVFITDRGQVTNVLLSIEEYKRLTGGLSAQKNIAELLAMQGFDSVEFTTYASDEIARAADFS